MRCFFLSSAAKKAKDTHPNGGDADASYARSSTRGITQVPEQISSLHLDHEMEDDDDMDANDDDDDNHTGTDHDQQQQLDSPVTNASDELPANNHGMHDDEHPPSRTPSISTSTHQRKRMFPLTSSRRLPPPPPPSSTHTSTANGKSDLLSVRDHLEKGEQCTCRKSMVATRTCSSSP